MKEASNFFWCVEYNFQVGEDTTLVSNSEIETTSFAELVQVLKDLYDPIPSIIQHFKFNSHIRAWRESVSQ